MSAKTYEESYLPLANFLSRIEVYCPSCGKRGCIHTDLPPISEQKKLITVLVDGGRPYCEVNYEWKKARFTCSSCPKVIEFKQENSWKAWIMFKKEGSGNPWIEFKQENSWKTWYGLIKGSAKAICYSCAQIGYKQRLSQEFYIEKCDLNHLHTQKTKIACPKCHSRTTANVEFIPHFDVDMLVDPIFGLPLFLSKAIGRNTIWAYNKEHLEHIKYFVQASQRKTIFKLSTAAKGNDVSMVQSFSQTLPAWIKKKSNRDNILKAISQMVKTL